MQQSLKINEQVLPTRETIEALQVSMIEYACKQPEPIHLFAPGLYLRELTVPAGMLIVGKTHRFAHFLLVMSGHALIVSEFGRDELTAGHISVSEPGVKRVVLAFKDTRFITIHHNPDDIEDLELIEAQHIVPEIDVITIEEILKLSEAQL